MNRPDGYRYIQAERVGESSHWRWQLWEVRAGKAKRMGTAWAEHASRVFLLGHTQLTLW